MYYLKPYLKERGYNLSWIANKLNMTNQRLSYHLQPKKEISLNLAIKLSDLLGMDLEEFIKSVEVKEEVQ